MIKKIVLEKLYILLTIIAIGGYSAMSLLSQESSTIYESTDRIEIKFFVGLLFLLTSLYIIANTKYINFCSIGKILLIFSCYLAISKTITLHTTASILSFFYHPIRELLVITLFIFANIIAAKSEELLKFFSTGLFLALIITAITYFKNWTFFNELSQTHLATAYYTLFLLPIILVSPYKWIRYCSIVIVGAAIISSFKRGGLIAFILAIVAYLFIKEVVIERKFTRILLFILLIIVMFLTLVYIDNSMGNIMTERLFNIAVDGGSGRNQIWDVTWDMIKRSDIEQLLFGHGYSAVIRDSYLEQSAHNDFIEVLYDWGLFIFIPYLFLHLLLIKQIYILIKQKSEHAPISAFAYVFFLILSVVSIVVLYPLMVLISMYWGVIYAKQIAK